MPDHEKELIQARHRLEEARARDRVKERKARTRRLIQEGAILEKAFPAAAAMELTELETELDGDLPITEFLEMYGISEDEFEADSDTIGGWTIESFGGRFPEAGESFSFGDLKISVLAMDGRRVERVLVKKKPKEPEENGKY